MHLDEENTQQNKSNKLLAKKIIINEHTSFNLKFTFYVTILYKEKDSSTFKKVLIKVSNGALTMMHVFCPFCFHYWLCQSINTVCLMERAHHWYQERISRFGYFHASRHLSWLYFPPINWKRKNLHLNWMMVTSFAIHCDCGTVCGSTVAM